MTRSLRIGVAVLALALAATACGSDDDESSATTVPRTTGSISATVANYELVAGMPQRFIVGVLRSDQEKVVSFGTVEMAFAYLGTRQVPQRESTVAFVSEGTFMPIAGQEVDPSAPGPRFVEGSEGIGVYGAPNITFDRPGFWGVQVTATIAGQKKVTQAQFEVVADNKIPGVGDQAPRTQNPVVGAAGVDPKSIDSRADSDTPVPDPELHGATIAAAIAARRPIIVVVSTPTYCMSRFCGPITDSVQSFAKRYADKIDFVHLEVWKDFEAKAINPAAAEWIYPDKSVDAKEPWTFAVGGDGIIKQRFDNVVTDPELQAAIDELIKT